MNKIDRSLLGPFVHWFFPKLLPWVPGWMTANLISLVGFLFTVFFALALVFVSASKWLYVAGALLILGHWVTDTMDGIVARGRGQASMLGDYVDHFGDCVSVVLIGVSLFAAGGSHIAIGLVCTTIYLLILNHVHIKARLFGALELPPIGPSEIRCLVAAVLLGQTVFDCGKPLSWFPGVTGRDGWLVRNLGFSSGLTFIDVVGLIAISVASIGIWEQVFKTLGQLRVRDRVDASQVAHKAFW